MEDVLQGVVGGFSILLQLRSGQLAQRLAVVSEDLPVVTEDQSEVGDGDHVPGRRPEDDKLFGRDEEAWTARSQLLPDGVQPGDGIERRVVRHQAQARMKGERRYHPVVELEDLQI